MPSQFIATLEEIKFYGEGDACNFSAKLLYELDGGVHGAAGGQEVVYEEDPLAGLDGVFVDFEGVGAVFEVVALRDDLGGELFGLADGDEAGVEAVGDGGGEDEAAGLGAEDDVDVLPDVVPGEGVNHPRETGAVLEQGGDVVEEDAGLGEVGDGADERLERLAVDVRH